MKWIEVPQSVRDVVTAHLGSVESVHEITVGQSSDLAVVVTTGDGRVFVKAVRSVCRLMRWLRNEIGGNSAAGALAPAVLFHVDLNAEDAADDEPWLIVGFEFVDGRPVSLAPGSPDLEVVGATLERIAATPASVDIRPLAHRWADNDSWQLCVELSPEVVAGWDIELMTRIGASVPALVVGDRLVHTDLHRHQILLSADGKPSVIDWGHPGAGAAWVDTALMIPRLIMAGHDTADAESWARDVPTLRDVEPDSLDAFACYIGGFWTHLDAIGRAIPTLSCVAREWAAWRLSRRGLTAASTSSLTGQG